MTKKKILFLGGADIQIPAIQKAIELGLHVITCDYLPNNPGHKISHEYHNVSTTDKEAVLALSQQLQIDGISAYASDPAAITAAYVADKMGIPGNDYASILKLSYKNEFRTLQRECGIRSPECAIVNSSDDIIAAAQRFPDGGILKPVDTSGSKGVFRILNYANSNDYDREQLEKMLAEAKGYSRVKNVIVEEYIQRKGFLMSGDFLIKEGKVVFYCFGDVHFNTCINGLVPRSISLPASLPVEFHARAIADVQKLLDHMKIRTGVFNVDIIQDQQGNPVLIDIGARNGGNLFNDIIFYHSGVNLIELSILQCIGAPYDVKYNGEILGYYAHNVLHAEEDGLFDGVEFSEEITPKIIYRSVLPERGTPVKKFVNSSFRVGLILLKFGSFEEMHTLLYNIHDHVKVNVKQAAV